MVFKVDKVRRADCGKNSRHIVGVIEVGNGKFHRNTDVVASIAEGNEWVTSVPKQPEATIEPITKCPRCGSVPYLRTVADNTAKNNLENLPEG